MRKYLAGFAVATLIFTGAIACSDGNHNAACASTLEIAKPGPSGGGGGGGGKTGGGGAKPPAPKPSPSPNGGNKSPSGGSTSKPPPPKTGTRTNSSTAPKPSVSRSGGKTTITPPGEKAYTPPPAKTKPSTADISKAQSTAPKTLTTTGSYTSTVTNHTYIYQSPSYFTTAGYLGALDLFNPYDPFNYYYRPFSPFYQHPYMVGSSCGGGDASEYKPSQEEFSSIETKLDEVNKKLDAGDNNVDTLDADPTVTTTTTAPVTTTSSG